MINQRYVSYTLLSLPRIGNRECFWFVEFHRFFFFVFFGNNYYSDIGSIEGKMVNAMKI